MERVETFSILYNNFIEIRHIFSQLEARLKMRKQLKGLGMIIYKSILLVIDDYSHYFFLVH